ncbi:protein phosphatase 1 regulatory subunit 12B isoform X2 [Sphaerodactylus townsendi]|uniref:protein phosphatase 1 regulatory subunit 12B isoform X2 n=1 Tax=Sphaerodactylus townsendi TaxID=933632 RepID=UPI0020268F45|nr:protein phosphatase 1 regulatory subunit 12B isoform X2 [Sphaerodactylus townsendi]
MSEPGHLGVKRAESAKLRRAEQLKRWKGSLTELEPVTPARSRHRGGARVRFEDGAVFLAACSSGDTEEVKRLLARGARLNTANVDGLTALHQACIDENLDMVKFLVEYGANVNQQDNEGWTPLHAVASCGYLNIAEYLISCGANVAAVNSEGEVPSDLAEEEAMKDLLQEQVKKQGTDLDQARKAEEQQMLQDARQWLNRRKIEDRKHPRTGATALHVAAAKGYSEVMRLLIQAGFDVNVQDNDGWTPLHAAAHWGVKEACSILAEALCDMDIRNKLGQTPFDVADEGLVEHLEMLQKKQNMLRSEETRNKLIEADMNGKLQSRLFRNKEKILYEPDTLKSFDHEEENKESSSSSSEEEAEEDDVSESDTEKEAERKQESVANHTSHEPRTFITEQVPPPEHNTFTMAPVRKITSSLLSKPEEQKDESPSSWRLSLRKTSSQNTLNESTAPRDALKDKGGSIYRSSSTPRISALLDNKEKDKDNKIYFASVAPRRLNSTGDMEEKENRESAVTLVRSGSYTRPLWRDEPKGNEAPATGAHSTYVSTYMKSASFGRSSDLSSPYISANRNSSPATSPTVLGSPTSLGTEGQLASCPAPVSSNTTASGRQYIRAPYRQQTDSAVEKSTENISSSIPLSVITNLAVPSTANGVTTANSNSTTGTESSTGDSRDRRRSYLTPVRDEEAESLRKARSRQARQTRRSTQGVTLTDLQEAERTFSRSRTERQAQEQPSEKSDRTEAAEDSSEKGDETSARETRETLSRWSRNLDEDSVSQRLRCPVPDKTTSPISPTVTPFPYSSSHLPRTSRSTASDSVNPEDFQSTAVGDMEKNESEDQSLDDRSSSKQSVRERRRPKERRRGTGISFYTKDDEEMGDTEEVKEPRHERLSRLDTASSAAGTSDSYGDRPSGRSSAYTRRENRLAALSSRTEDDTSRDYKKLYESALAENQKLKSKLQDAQVELADIKSKLDKIAQQKQEKTSDRSSMLEIEKREKRALERKLSEMEEGMKNLHQLKQIHTLRQMNEQLLAENRALTRVVARLSQSTEPPESEEL